MDEQSSTQFKDVSLDILQSTLYSCQNQKDFKLKISLQLDPETFEELKSRLNPIADEENQVIDDDSDEEEEEVQENHVQKQEEKQRFVDKLSGKLEESTILKENYEVEIDEIGKKTGTRILIVPQKVKYFGFNVDAIEQAREMVYNLRQKINIHNFPKNGAEIYESRIFRKELKEMVTPINLCQITDRYYFWYESEENSSNVSNLIQRIINKIYHTFYSLKPTFKNNFPSNYINSIIKLKGKIFDQEIKNFINEGLKEENQVQLGISENSLILHCEVEEHIEIQKKRLSEIYHNFIYFFIVYGDETGPNENDEKPKNITQLKKILTSNRVYWHYDEQTYIMVIAYEKKALNQMNESAIKENEIIQDRKKVFLSEMKEYFETNLSCEIAVLKDDEYGVQISEDLKQPNFLTITDKPGIRIYSPKSKRVERFIQIIKMYILGTRQKKQKIIPKTNDSFSVNSISMIHDKSSILQSELSMTMEKGGSEKILPDDIKMTKKFSLLNFLTNYKVKLQDNDKEQKYSSVVEEVTKGKNEKKTYQTEVEQLLNAKYKVYKINIPEDHKVDLGNENIVTVFVAQSERKKLYTEDEIDVLLLRKCKKLRNHGWFANVKKENIEVKEVGEEKKKLIVKPGTYQIINYIKFVSEE